MMSFYKSFHTLFGFPNPDERRRNPNRDPAGLRFLASDPPKPRNVLESSAVGKSQPPSPPQPDRADPGAWGLHDSPSTTEITESLGSESCDGGETEEIAKPTAAPQRRRRWRSEEKKRREFPPPLPWLTAGDGRRRCFMKGERKDGRLVLTEVRIERPEIMKAWRQNGRLRLEMVGSDGGGERKREAVGPTREARALTCQGEVSGENKEMGMWWGHRFVTTA